jgi:hypothetical protein
MRLCRVLAIVRRRRGFTPDFVYGQQHVPSGPASGGPQRTMVAGELFKKMTGVELVHVPYRGAGLALSDMIGGQVFDPIPSSVEYVRSGELRALAVTTAKRSEVLPELPPVSDFVRGYEVSAWQGIEAPKNTPADAAVLQKPDMNSKPWPGLQVLGFGCPFARDPRRDDGAARRAEPDLRPCAPGPRQ